MHSSRGTGLSRSPRAARSRLACGLGGFALVATLLATVATASPARATTTASVTLTQSSPNEYAGHPHQFTASVNDAGAPPPAGTMVQFQPHLGLYHDDAYVGIASSAGGTGYWIVGYDGKVRNEGTAPALGNGPAGMFVVGIASTPSGNGYYLVGDNGKVVPEGDAVWHGDTSQINLNQPVTGIAVMPDNSGYWLVAADGGIFSYGGAPFRGSTGGQAISAPIIGMAVDSATDGYWLLGEDGAVYAFSAPVRSPAQSQGIFAVGITPTFDGGGYTVMGIDGTLYPYGDANPAASFANDNAPMIAVAAALTASNTADYWGVGLDGQVFGTGVSNVGDAFTVPVSGSTASIQLTAFGIGQTDMTAKSLGATSNDVVTNWQAPGYWEVASDGGIFTFGDAQFHGSKGGQRLNSPIVGMAPTPDGGGYWMVASDGGIFTEGDAPFYGSLGGQHLDAPVVGMAATTDGGGYWLVESNGEVFPFGDATDWGSITGSLNRPIVGIADTPDDGGYWLVASDGGIFTFGDAVFLGSQGGKPLNKPIVGMSATSSGFGYRMVASDGGIFDFGDAQFYGSQGGKPLNKPVVGMWDTVDDAGYALVATDGGIFNFGDSLFYGSKGGQPLNAPVVGGAEVTFDASVLSTAAAPRMQQSTLSRAAYDRVLFEKRLG